MESNQYIIPSQYRDEVNHLRNLYLHGISRPLFVSKTTLIGCTFHGLFAGKSYQKGDIVCVYRGTRLSTKDAMHSSDKSYLMRLGEQTYIDAKHHPDVMARFMNDCILSCGHNVVFEKYAEQNCAHAVALRDIEAGEELFVDYGKWYWAGKKPTGLLRLTDKLLQSNPQLFQVKLLELNLVSLSKKVLLQTQKLTISFCVKYILPSPAAFDKESGTAAAITLEDVLFYQSHIQLEDLQSYYQAYHSRK